MSTNCIVSGLFDYAIAQAPPQPDLLSFLSPFFPHFSPFLSLFAMSPQRSPCCPVRPGCAMKKTFLLVKSTQKLSRGRCQNQVRFVIFIRRVRFIQIFGVTPAEAAEASREQETSKHLPAPPDAPSPSDHAGALPRGPAPELEWRSSLTTLAP
jgi:hypothetical protein